MNILKAAAYCAAVLSMILLSPSENMPALAEGGSSQQYKEQTKDIPEYSKCRNFPILTERRINLIREYVKKHYNLNDIKIIGPEMVVVHYTVTSTISETLNMFKPDELNSSRSDIIKGGLLNVGIHYVIDSNGDIWSLLPAYIIGRHTIGFNHVSIGIELVAASEKHLTEAQIKSCSALVAQLCGQYKSIKYLIGHHEYMNKNLPHFSLYKELDNSYSLTKKTDPGDKFMIKLRSRLKRDYNIELKL